MGELIGHFLLVGSLLISIFALTSCEKIDRKAKAFDRMLVYCADRSSASDACSQIAKLAADIR